MEFSVMNKNTKAIFHFTLGPVQSFVSQARRTRDLWAGSFLLSWLSAQAMREVLMQGGTLVFPDVGQPGALKDPMLRALERKEKRPPRIGSLPNRFKAEVPDDFCPSLVEEAVSQKWRELAEAVYEEFVEDVAKEHGFQTKTIWERQVNGFWEINWVLGSGHTGAGIPDHGWLEARKNWRNFWPPEEGGEHCMLMGDYQEISGHLRTTAEDRECQDTFWRRMQEVVPDGRLDLRDNERLCAIALIKRLFPKIEEKNLKEIIGWIPGEKYSSIANWPSTTYMAVVPWLEHIAAERARIRELEQYVVEVRRQVGDDVFRKLASERAIRFGCLEPLHEIAVGTGARLDDLDGDLLHPHALNNHRTLYLSERRPPNFDIDPDEKKRKKLVEALQKLNRAVERTARSYYALLLMDGDRLGELLRKHDPGTISQALLEFTEQVSPEVAGWDGITIYAGGDDVLALLPLNKVLGCARRLREIYGDCFSNLADVEVTASSAIVFAHHQYPLQGVVREAHHQLEEIAKEENGRDSLAIAILKPSGVTAQWVNPWERVSLNDNLEKLVAEMEKGVFPRGFYHKLEDRYRFLQKDAPDGIDLRRLLVAEYLQSRERDVARQEAERNVDLLLNVCRPYRRGEDGRSSLLPGLRLGGGFIARFMTQEDE